MYPVTAQDELLKRIHALDREETNLRRKAGNLLAEGTRLEGEAEAKAVLRRQFEFAFTQLGGELRKADKEPKPKNSGHLVASLG